MASALAAVVVISAAACSSSEKTVVADNPRQAIEKVSGDTQSASFDSPVANPLRVKVTYGGAAKSGVIVSFASTSGLVSAPLDTTDANGIAETRFVNGIDAGPQSVTASIDTGLVTSVGFNLTATAWLKCANQGGQCAYTGLRDVRYGVGTTWTQVTTYEYQYCLTGFFRDIDPAPGQTKTCEMGPAKRQSLTNPNPGVMGLKATVMVPIGVPGTVAQQVRTATQTPVFTDGSGSFRTTCDLSHFSFDDPIVHPNAPGTSHLHIFMGNTGTNAASTTTSISNSGNSTCRGGVLNRSSYWAPALIDTRDGTVVVPFTGIFYYKTGYSVTPSLVQTMPAGLRIIAGDMNSSTAQEHAVWSCRDKYRGDFGSIPKCDPGDVLQMKVLFPQCWDGVNLDSPDHKSHMRYPDFGKNCPPSHPVALPEISERFEYTVPASADLSKWRLSSDMYSSSLPGGFSAHADWFLGWDTGIMSLLVRRCLNTALDCGVGALGDGREIY